MLALLPPPAHATSYAISEAVMDWQGLSFTTTGTLHITKIDQPFELLETGVIQTGTAQAVNFTDQGLSSRAEASTVELVASENHASGSASAITTAWLYGSGNGYVTVSVPYHLHLTLQEDQPRGTPGLNDGVLTLARSISATGDRSITSGSGRIPMPVRPGCLKPQPGSCWRWGFWGWGGGGGSTRRN